MAYSRTHSRSDYVSPPVVTTDGKGREGKRKGRGGDVGHPAFPSRDGERAARQAKI